MGTNGTDQLVTSLCTLQTWIILGTAAICGIVGGYARKLTSPSEDTQSTPPLKDKKYWLSWWGALVVGAVASLAVLYVFPLENEFYKLVALSLAAGYGGKAILDALEARIKTAIEKEKTARAKEDGKKAIGAGGAVVTCARNLEVKLGKWPNAFSPELKTLSDYLDFLGESFK